ncbi:hypothetical protein ETZ13_10835 [Acinetobacter junii]|nr:hypothetical protein ETZ13_10835 [Acinetobacter junii]
MIGLVAFFSAFLLSRLINFSTASLSKKEVSMKKHIFVALTMFVNCVATNLFSTELGLVHI